MSPSQKIFVSLQLRIADSTKLIGSVIVKFPTQSMVSSSICMPDSGIVQSAKTVGISNKNNIHLMRLFLLIMFIYLS